MEKNFVIATKIALILLCIFSLSSCEKDTFPKSDSLSNLRINQNVDEKKETKYDEIRKAEIEKQFNEFLREIAKKFKVSILRKEEFSDDQIEIRFWRFSSFGTKDSVVILKRTNQQWTSILVQSVVKMSDLDKKNPPNKIIRKKLNNSDTDYEQLWKVLIDEEILTLPDGDEVGNEPCPDCEMFMVETKVGNDYRTYDYHAPDYFKEIREAQQIVRIFELIADEFGVSELKTS